MQPTFIKALREWDGADYRGFPRKAPPCECTGNADIDQRLAATFAVLCSGFYPTDDAKMNHLWSMKRRWINNAVRWQEAYPEQDLTATFSMIETIGDWFEQVHSDVPDSVRKAA